MSLFFSFFVSSYHQLHNRCNPRSHTTPSMLCRQVLAAVAGEVEATVGEGRVSRTLTSGGRSFWNATGLQPPAADRRGNCGSRRWRRKPKSWRTQTYSYRWGALCVKTSFHTDTMFTSRATWQSVFVFSQNEVTSLRSEVGQLKQILLTHKDCPVTARQREAQGYPSE